MKTIHLGALALVAGIVGCSDGSDGVGSEDIDTRTIRADIRAEALSDSQTQLNVSLSQSTDTEQKIRLENADTLTATAGGTTTALSLKENSPEPVYVGMLSAGTAGTVITVNLQRTTPPSSEGLWIPIDRVDQPDFGDGFIDAPASTATLPTSFAISSPTAGTEFTTRGDIVTVTWTPNAANDMRLLHSTTCPAAPANNAVTTTGEISIDGDPGTTATTIAQLLGTQSGTSQKCSIQLDLIREANGTLDPAFRTGAIVGTQRRTVSITYSP